MILFHAKNISYAFEREKNDKWVRMGKSTPSWIGKETEILPYVWMGTPPDRLWCWKIQVDLLRILLDWQGRHFWPQRPDDVSHSFFLAMLPLEPPGPFSIICDVTLFTGGNNGVHTHHKQMPRQLAIVVLLRVMTALPHYHNNLPAFLKSLTETPINPLLCVATAFFSSRMAFGAVFIFHVVTTAGNQDVSTIQPLPPPPPPRMYLRGRTFTAVKVR